jgi:hypothetical protein
VADTYPDMHLGMCADMCIDRWMDMCIGMCITSHLQLVCAALNDAHFIEDLSIDMCIDTCIDTCTDMCIDTRIYLWIGMSTDRHVLGHVCERAPAFRTTMLPLR